MNHSASNWSDLPTDLLSLVAGQKILDLADVVRMTAVCKSWRISTFRDHYEDINGITLRPSPIPRLMLSETPNSTTSMRGFFDLTSGRVVEMDLPEAQDRRCCGSAFGWLITIGLDMEIHLLKPMSRLQIRLPSQLTFTDLGDGLTNDELHAEDSREEMRNMFFHRIILTDSPESGKCIVAAILTPGSGLRLAYTRLGDESWTIVSETSPDTITFYQGKFYGIHMWDYLVVLDINHPENDWQQVYVDLKIDYKSYFKRYDPFGARFYLHYLVEILDELLVVVRLYEHDKDGLSYWTEGVLVMKFSEGKWCKVDSLGDCCLLLGGNTPMCLSPVPKGCRSNCIYFADNNKEWSGTDIMGGHDMGVYSMKDDTYSPFYKGVSTSSFSPPIWVLFDS